MSELGYCYSENDEDYRDDGLETLFEQMIDKGTFRVGAEYWRGEVRRREASEFFSADRVIEEANERAYDDGGDYAEDFADVSEEAKAELEVMLAAWANKHCPVNFFTVHAATKMQVTEAEYAEYAPADYVPDDSGA